MFCNLFSSISTRKSAAPTTMQSQPRPATPLEHPSKLRGAIQTVFKVLHLRRSKPKNDKPIEDSQVPQTPAVPYQHPSTTTQHHKLIFTSAVPLTAATPSTTASLAALADISPLFVPQPAESTTTPTTTFSRPSAFPSPPAATDVISTKDMIAELGSAVSRLQRQGAHQAHIHKLDNAVATGREKVINQRNTEAEARRRAEGRLARNIASRKKVEDWMLQQRDRRWDLEDAAGEVLRHLETTKKKKDGPKKKILQVDLESPSDFLTPDEALQGLGLVDVWDPRLCPMSGDGLPPFLEQVYGRVGSGQVGRAADVSGEEACHSSGYDKRGRGLSNAPRPRSPVWFKNGRDFPGPYVHREPHGTGEGDGYGDAR